MKYLSGIVAGAMIPPRARICYVKPYNTSDCNVDLNAFATGVFQSNPTAKIDYWISNSYTNEFKMDSMANYLLEKENCDMYVLHTDSVAVTKLAQRGLVTSSTSDGRILSGENVLSR